MNSKCSFLIVCFFTFAACHTPRQVVLKETVEVPVTIRDTILVETPVYRDTGSVVILPAGNYDSLFFEWEKQWTEVIMHQDTATRKRIYKVTSGTKPDTVFVPVTLFDTIKVEIEKECPPTLPSAPRYNITLWSVLLALLIVLLIEWAGNRKKTKM